MRIKECASLPRGGSLDEGEIKIRCPHCGYETRKTLAWARGRTKHQCAGCGDEFRLHKTKLRKALDAVIRALRPRF
jgi:DNA-directed RNA polymerase subunit RPC12/RpoP